MAPLEAWTMIITRLENKRIELPTVPKRKKIPVWFTATTDGKTIFINEASEHRPSSKISVPRKLSFGTFQKVYPLYLRRENGEAISSEVTAITVNQVYYFSLIKHFCLYQQDISSYNIDYENIFLDFITEGEGYEQ